MQAVWPITWRSPERPDIRRTCSQFYCSDFRLAALMMRLHFARLRLNERRELFRPARERPKAIRAKNEYGSDADT